MTTWVDATGTIAAGSVSQELFPASGSRTGARFYNPSTNTDTLWITNNATATEALPSFPVTPGSFFDWQGSVANAVQVIGPNAGVAYWYSTAS